ncbi:hypothetical protein M9H77_19257 [Catharanthus roseus]|uniref:Uncharacterized protein n=1 Tax=Catharanthus roseus TaxID=4058 RepID=A0ACC0B9T5_CATRO|nr:hypothetical protein M9H77_19257 [Catharanthus roseus]
MERKSSILGFIVFLLILTQEKVNGQGGNNNLYTCWGGCYNKCFLLGGNPADRYPCYFSCLAGCTSSQSTGNYRYYCQVGCSATRCVPLGSDGARLEDCLGSCGNICRA